MALLKVNVPQPLWSYLGRLAQLSALGSSETEVALFLLKEQVKRLQEGGFLEKSIQATAPFEASDTDESSN